MNSSSSADLLFATFMPFLFVASYHSALPSLQEAPAPGPHLITWRVPTDAQGLGLQPRAGLTLALFRGPVLLRQGPSSVAFPRLVSFALCPGGQAPSLQHLAMRQGWSSDRSSCFLSFFLSRGTLNIKKNTIRCDILSNSTTPR